MKIHRIKVPKKQSAQLDKKSERERENEDLIHDSKDFSLYYQEKEKLEAELITVNRKLALNYIEKEKLAAELSLANKELRFQNDEKEKRAAELIVANLELTFQNNEKEKRASELILANKELAFQNEEKEKRASELILANKELAFQNEEKEKRASELILANKELVFQNEEKEKRASELIIANKNLLAFTYVSSHDLQEPLRKIQNFVSIILKEDEKNLSANGKLYFNRMEETARRMHTLIEDLLSFSRTTTSERIFEKLNILQIVEDVVQDFEEVIEQKKGIIKCNTSCEINVIPFQFRQLMHNLIGNSLKFQKNNSPPIITIKCQIENGLKLNTSKLQPAKQYFHIIFTDNGIGFDPQYKERIFEMFQRLHTYDEYKGTGIGLAICRRIVENHNSLMTATGKLNIGARFDIYIPIS